MNEQTEHKEQKKMKPIWYFVGLVLLTIGILVFLTGIAMLVFGVKSPTALANLHPNIWWGAIMVVAGAVFFFKNR
jgi:FtsH-binding integral membrane protein